MRKTKNKAKLTRKETKDRKMTEGYKAMAEEQKRFAVMAANIESEVLPDW